MPEHLNGHKASIRPGILKEQNTTESSYSKPQAANCSNSPPEASDHFVNSPQSSAYRQSLPPSDPFKSPQVSNGFQSPPFVKSQTSSGTPNENAAASVAGTMNSLLDGMKNSGYSPDSFLGMFFYSRYYICCIIVDLAL